jgi:hypothetical protein
MQVSNVAFQLLQALTPYPLRESESIPKLAAQVHDWWQFYALAERHSVTNNVVLNLQANQAHHLLPAPVWEQFKRRRKDHLLNATYLTREIIQIGQALEQAQIPYWVMKGAPLSQLLFGAPHIRSFGDLDIIVPPAALDYAGQVLQKTLGFRRTNPSHELTPRQRAYLMRHHHHIIYENPSQRYSLELHWGIIEEYLMPQHVAERILARAVSVPLGEKHIRTIDLDSMLAVSILHGAKHQWARLKFLFDLDSILRVLPTPDWDYILDILHATHTERVAASAGILLQRAFHRPVPAPLQPKKQPNREVTRLVDDAWQALLADSDYTENYGFKARLRLTRYRAGFKAGWKHRLFMLEDLFFSYDDWAAFPLPDVLFPLYLPLRPFFSALRVLQRKR